MLNTSAAQDNEYEVYHLRTVVIDPGHGGRDPGASGRSSREKDIVLNVAMKVGDYIKQYLPDVEVIYTRDDDTFVPLDQRAEIANKAKADLFISIHANAVDSKHAYGAETWVMGLHKTKENLEVAKMENSAILYEEDYSQKYEGFEPNSSESYIIFSMLQNTHLEQSLDYAAYLQDEFHTRALRRDRGVKQAGFVVLWQTTMPSVLVELGFLSNPKEEAYLNSHKGQEHMASAIFRAFRDYKSKVEKQSRLLVQKEQPAGVMVQNNDTILNDTINNNFPEIYFKVQVASATRPIEANSDYFKGIEQVEEFQTGTYYKYAAGFAKSYQEIVQLRKKIIEYFPDAFIVGVENGQLIPVREAIEKLKKP
jgi:N-acetylmuramoyl-L-alanine amidase